MFAKLNFWANFAFPLNSLDKKYFFFHYLQIRLQTGNYFDFFLGLFKNEPE